MRRFALVLLLAGCAHDATRTDRDAPGPVAADPPPTPEPKHETLALKSAPEKRSTGTITRAELVAVLDAAPGRFLQNVDSEPRFEDGRFRGWRLASFFPGDDRFAAVDLQPGDVVLKVNGQSIERPDELMQVWQELRSGRALVVTFEREGRARELRYDIRD